MRFCLYYPHRRPDRYRLRTFAPFPVYLYRYLPDPGAHARTGPAPAGQGVDVEIHGATIVVPAGVRPELPAGKM